jgi:hypothetical protein
VVPYFNPALIEVAVRLRLFRFFKLADTFRTTKGKSISVGTLIVLLSLGSLAYGPKVDYLSHSVALEG